MLANNDPFQKLISQITINIEKMMSTSNIVVPIGLAIIDDSNVLLVKGNEKFTKLSQHMNAIQTHLQKEIGKKAISATAIAYPDYDNYEIIAYIENNENVCVKVRIPVIVKNRKFELNLSSTKIEKGTIYVFPNKSQKQ